MERTTTIVVDDPQVRSVFYNNTFYDTNIPAEVTVSDALRLSRLFKVNVSYPDVEYNPELWKKDRTFILAADADTTSGFGNCTVNLLKYSEADKCDVRWLGRGIQINDISHLQKKSLPLDAGIVWHDQPRDYWNISPFHKQIAIVPFETTRIPQSWVPKLNKLSALFVPCEQNIQMMKDSGVHVPIELIHWGVDETKFHPVNRDNKIFTFGTMGALSLRKGTDILIDAFRKAFPISYFNDVRLLLKTSYNTFPFGTKDYRIQVLQGQYDLEIQYDRFINKIDCFVFPTRGEGFGLPPLEMMATGVPSIVTGWSGPVDYMTPETGWLIDYDMEEASDFSKNIYREYCGQWAKPKVDHLIELMRYAYYHRDEVKQKGLAAAEHVKNNWLWSNKIKMFTSALDKHLS